LMDRSTFLAGTVRCSAPLAAIGFLAPILVFRDKPTGHTRSTLERNAGSDT